MPGRCKEQQPYPGSILGSAALPPSFPTVKIPTPPRQGGDRDKTLWRRQGAAQGSSRAPWHRVSHCHHRRHGAGQAQACRWLLALPAPPGMVPVGDTEGLRAAGW